MRVDAMSKGQKHVVDTPEAATAHTACSHHRGLPPPPPPPPPPSVGRRPANLLLSASYVTSCEVLPTTTRGTAAPSPSAKAAGPSVRSTRAAVPSMDSDGCCRRAGGSSAGSGGRVPTCIMRVLTTWKGLPKTAPSAPVGTAASTSRRTPPPGGSSSCPNGPSCPSSLWRSSAALVGSYRPMRAPFMATR